MDFCIMVEYHEVCHGESLVQAIDLVLAYLPYNARRVRYHEHLAYNLFSAQDIKDLVSFAKM